MSARSEPRRDPDRPVASSDTGPRSIRLATPGDLARVREIVSKAYEKYLERMDRPPSAPWDYSRQILDEQLWVIGSPVLGVICLVEMGDGLEIENIAVHPSAQGKGIGRNLMEFAERRGRELNKGRLTLRTDEVMVENQAIYTHLGFTETRRAIEHGYRRVFMEKPLANSG